MPVDRAPRHLEGLPTVTTRALVLAHGDGWRWNDENGVPYLGVPKQLIEIDGETLLCRTVRLLGERADTMIVGPDARFAVAGAQLKKLDEPDPCRCEMSKFAATRHLWSPDGRTTIFWGDCYYTEAAMDTILGHAGEDVHYFRRPWPSTLTGHEWDESFAVTFLPEHHAAVMAAAWHVAALLHAGKLPAVHIRTHYARMLGLHDAYLDAVTALEHTPHQTVIDDETDDFDTPEDYERWNRLLRA